jgi:(S)-ureidoglycine aminohydrolase
MKKFVLLFGLCLPFFALAQKDSIISGVYNWKEPAGKGKALSAAVLLEGKAHDMEWLQMHAYTLRSAKTALKQNVPDNEEHLLIIKEGQLDLSLKNTSHTINSGSVALLMPGEEYTVQNKAKQPCRYYVMKYRNRRAMDVARGTGAGGSVVIDRNKTDYKPHDKGGRRDFFERPTAMSPRLEMHVSTLNPALKSHEPHTHRAEEIVLIIEGNTSMQIGDKMYNGRPGSLYYLGSNVLHAIKNEGTQPATYFAFQFE